MNPILIALVIVIAVAVLLLAALAGSSHKANAQINQEALAELGRLPKWVGTQSRAGEASFEDW